MTWETITLVQSTMNKLATTCRKAAKDDPLPRKGMGQGMITMLLPVWLGAAKAVFSSQ
jgi:hypothetical protein